MNTLILKAPGVLTNPVPGTPLVPDLSRSVLLEYNAEKLIVIDGADVATWPNSDGSWGNVADLLYASATRPKMASNGVSQGHAAVRFSKASATLLKTNSVVALVPRVETPLTVMALVKFNAPADGSAVQNIFSGRTGDAGGFVYARRDALGRMNIGSGGVDQLINSTPVPVGTWFTVSCVFDGANSKLFIDKVKTTGTCGASYWDGISLGANAVAINNMDGDIAVVKAYSRALSDAEVLLQREAWMTARGLAA